MIQKIFELFRYKELIKILVARDLKVRYRNSFLGYVWTWLDPLMTMSVFIVVFGVFFKTQIRYFPVYLLCGLVPFTFFISAVTASVSSITSNAGLIKRVYYPREIFPLTITLSNAVTMFLGFLVLIPVASAFGIPITPKILLFPITSVFLMLFTIGLSLAFATLNVFIRDTMYIVPFILKLWFYLTPVFYSVENRVPRYYVDIYMSVNPLAVLLTLFRSSFMDYAIPKATYITTTFTLCIVMFWAGYAFFKINEDRMVKRI